MQNPQEFPAQLKCHKCHNSARSLVRGECDACQQAPRATAGICGGCGSATTHYRKSGMPTWGWMCAPCWDGVVPAGKKDDRATIEGWEDGKSYSGTNTQIVTAAHTWGHIDWAKEIAAVHEKLSIRGTAREEARRAFLRDTCPECGNSKWGHTPEECLEAKAKQGIYAALVDLRSHGADMRVRISRLRWMPKYTPKAEPAGVPVPRRRMTFWDFIHKIADAIFNFFN